MAVKLYIVSGDVFLLMKQWAGKQGFTLPGGEFFVDMREEFTDYMRNVFKSFEFIPEGSLSVGIETLIGKSNLPSISLDRVYHNSGLNLELTRVVDRDGNDKGLSSRGDAISLSQQLRVLDKSSITEAVLVDDVIFSGNLVIRVKNILEKRGIRVPTVCAGVGIGQGIEQIKTAGCEVYCVYTFSEVIDEVCERDFFPGVPLSGRSLTASDNVGIPYILPFGKPGKWASIPEGKQKDFSQFCLKKTIALFQAIEECSDKPVSCRDLTRKVILLPNDETNYIEALRQFL